MFTHHNWTELLKEVSNRKITRNIHSTWKLNDTLLKNICIKEKASKETIKYCALKGNENITYQNLCRVVKVIFQGKFTVINTYIGKGKRSQLNKVSTSGKQNREAQNKPRASRRKEIIIIRTKNE